MRRNGAIARAQRRGARARANGAHRVNLEVVVASRVWHQTRVEGDANQGLIDVGDDVSEALFEVAEHLLFGKICRWRPKWVLALSSRAGLCLAIVYN